MVPLEVYSASPALTVHFTSDAVPTTTPKPGGSSRSDNHRVAPQFHNNHEVRPSGARYFEFPCSLGFSLTYWDNSNVPRQDSGHSTQARQGCWHNCSSHGTCNNNAGRSHSRSSLKNQKRSYSCGCQATWTGPDCSVCHLDSVIHYLTISDSRTFGE